MKHNLLKSVITSVILLMGVSNAWGKTVNGPRIYFDNSSMNMTSTQVYFVVGHNSFSRTYGPMTEISDTKLLYRDISKETYYNWEDATYVGFVQVGSKWGDGSWGSSNLKNATNYTAANTSWNSFDWQNTYYCKANSKGGAVTIDYKSSGYSGIPKYNATQAAQLRNDISSDYETVDGTWPTTLKLQGTYLSGDGASARSEISGTASTNAESNRVYGAVVTGKITHTYNTISGNYIFEGWGTGNTPSTTKASYEYNITANTTVYAFFTKAYTVTYGKKGESGSSTVLATATANSTTKNISSSTKVAAGSTIKLTATPASGYRVVGWYSDANCTNQLQNGGNTYNAGTLTAAKTVYVKFEETKYDVTIQAGANGSVSPSEVQKVGNVTPVTITATANNGYTFTNWTKTGNVTITDAKSASTTIKATGTGTVTANFETAKRIYLKPAGDNDWANGNPRYAVYVIDDQTWHNMTKINDGDGNTGNDIYYCDIKSTDQKVIFCRMDPNNATNGWDGIRWTQTEDLTLPDNCNMFDIAKDASTENYDKASGTWMEYNAWHLTGAFNEWALCGQTFKEQGDGSFTFTTHLEAGNTYEFKLLHNGEWYGNNGTMVRGTSTGWTMSTSEDNCKITADYTGDYTFTFDVSTKKLTVRYPILITLVRSEFGPYGIKYNGQSYFSHKDKDVIINVPYGATINFIEGQPYSDIYTGGIMQSAPVVDKKRQVELNQPFTVLNDVTFDDNYVTKVDQVAYLGVPNNNCDWDKNASYANFTWRFDSDDKFPMTNSKDKAEFAFEEDGVNYYKFTIPAGCNKFQIQRKQARNDDENNQNETFSHTCDHEYMVLNTGINCYMLDNGTFNKNTHTGHWCELPPAKGDYRLLYIEQKVEKEDWKTVITRTKAHPSNIIREGTNSQIVSLYINAEGNHPEVILQQYDGTNWTNQERHMVLGPLTADAGMAMLPGRRNATNENILIYDDGIEVIKNDVNNHEYKGSGVWNFTVVQDGSSAHLDLTANGLERYTGEYYIRCDVAFGQWNGYKCSDNHMTRSNVSMQNSNYSHYYCKWIKDAGTNIKFTVANDYGHSISDTLTADMTDMWGTEIADNQKMVTGETLPASANVRFTWNEKTNLLHRAYIAGSSNVSDRFLVLQGDAKLFNISGDALTAGTSGSDRYGLNANEEIFKDNSNWVYYTDVQMKPNAPIKVTAKYNTKVQYFIGTEENSESIFAGTNSDNKYKIRLTYDFKTNQLAAAYIPNSETVLDAIAPSIMLIREGHGEASQLKFIGEINEELDVWGVIEFKMGDLREPANAFSHSLYWISFPFNVNLNEVVSFGEYGKHWIIETYNGAKRAEEGLWIDSESNWEFEWDQNIELQANTGYIVALDIDQIKADYSNVNNNDKIGIYFPANTTITKGFIQKQSHTTTADEHLCKINRNTPDGDRRIKDSNWNVIGVPSFANAGGGFGDHPYDDEWYEGTAFTKSTLPYLYEWDPATNTYEAQNGKTYNFKSMHAYMVQYAGDITWTEVIVENIPASIAARKNTDYEAVEHNLRLELQHNETKVDHTYITLQEDNVTPAFDFNYDLCKVINSGANIYTLIATDRDPIELAGNALPIANTVIPVGVQIATAGEYTFAMPDGTDGIVVELIDYETNTTTNLMLDEYTVDLAAGTNEARFALHVKPNKVTTSLEDGEITTTNGKVRKFLIDGVLYLQKDGNIYDAQGKLIR